MGQAAHSADPGGAYFPTSHAKHCQLATSARVAAGQVWHPLLPPVEKLPAKHMVAADMPAVGQKLPAGQDRQAVGLCAPAAGL